jgi:hypothetical protein
MESGTGLQPQTTLDAGSDGADGVYSFFSSQVYLQQNKKKAEAEGKNCHAETMLSLEKHGLSLMSGLSGN